MVVHSKLASFHNILRHETIARLLVNSKKAILEHVAREKHAPHVYATIEEGVPTLEQVLDLKSQPSISYTHKVAAEKGNVRENMEDAHFYHKVQGGILAGLFDGHGGKAVSQYACKAFRTRFSDHLECSEGNVREAFDSFFDIIHREVATHSAWDRMGSTAVVCFVEQKTNLIYTATLGDSEANIYRLIDGKMKSIPLSCIRDWSSPKDAKRAAEDLNDPTIADVWPTAGEPKHLRFPSPFRGVNVSRSIGDMNWSPSQKIAISHKPKVTLSKVQKGDVIILACDGLKDFVKEETIIEVIQECRENHLDPTKKLIDYALNVELSEDNVSVLAISAT